MKHPVRDRALILLCALIALLSGAGCVAVVLRKVSLSPVIELMTKASLLGFKTRIVLICAAVVLVLLGLLLIGITLPFKKVRSSNFTIQQNENGMVRISLKALESLVQRCLNQHAELKVITSSLFSDEETVRVDVHITLQSDISMPLAVSALQKQIKRYLEACSGVTVREVRVFVDGTTPPSNKGEVSPYAIPQTLLGIGHDALPATDEPKVEEKKEPEALSDEPEVAQAQEEKAEGEQSAEQGEQQAQDMQATAEQTKDEKDEGEMAW